MVTIVLTDGEAVCGTFQHEDRTDAFKALYHDLVERNEGDCAAAIERGFISVPGGAYSPDIVLAQDPDGFWQACCMHLLTASQDLHIEAE